MAEHGSGDPPPVLRLGDRDAAVTELCALLRDVGALDPSASDPGASDPGASDPGASDPGASDAAGGPRKPDEFDRDVERAVRAFQQHRGITVDGVVGPATRKALDEASWRLGD